MRILVVDDDATDLLIIKRWLLGHGVTCVDTAAQAIESLRNHSFDVVLIDRNMPGVDGETLNEMIQRLHRETPVVLMSGDSHGGRFIEKSKSELLNAVSEIKQRKRPE